MLIQADKEGIEAIKELCHIVLQVQGLKALQGINKTLEATKPIKNEPEEPDKKE